MHDQSASATAGNWIPVLCSLAIERRRIVPIHSMQAHIYKRLMSSQRIEKRGNAVDVERLGLGTELALKESGVDEYCVFHKGAVPRAGANPLTLVLRNSVL